MKLTRWCHGDGVGRVREAVQPGNIQGLTKATVPKEPGRETDDCRGSECRANHDLEGSKVREKETERGRAREMS